MSFTTDIKKEIAYNELKPCCAKSELSALIQLCSSLQIRDQKLIIAVKTENPTTAKRILQLLKSQYDVQTELSVIRKVKLKKNYIYNLRVINNAMNILIDLGIYNEKGLLEHPYASLVTRECCARAYLAGAFMATGSCNNPTTSNYHLEIVSITESHAKFIDKLMHRFYLSSKIIERRGKYVIYIKASEKIGDFLRCVGAQQYLLEFENVRINRDFKNSLTRLDNCDVANEIKSIKAAQKQIMDIEKLQDADRLEKLDNKLKDVAYLRLKYPEHSLKELCDEYKTEQAVIISKSGMKHRFVKLHDLAEKL
jgi:DNA-binding protein WhiA